MYSVNDIKFRLVRNVLLSSKEYENIMNDMFKEKKFNPKSVFDILFLNERNIIEMKKLGHSIGLHSHSHPMKIENLSYNDQKKEYKDNIDYLSKILNCKKNEIKYMSHPCGSYNNDTLSILDNFGIELGFKQIMTIEKEKNMKKINNSKLEIARQDHSIIKKMMN